MSKVYRVSIRNASQGSARELLYEVYTSKKKAQAMCNAINAIDSNREARVVTKER